MSDQRQHNESSLRAQEGELVNSVANPQEFAQSITPTHWIFNTRPAGPQSSSITYVPLIHFLRIDDKLLQSSLSLATSEYRNTTSIQHIAELFKRLMQQPRLTLWLKSDRSDLIVLRPLGHEVNQASDYGYFAATMAETLSSESRATVLHFFCPVNDPFSPPGSALLLRSLIHQLFSQQGNSRGGILYTEISLEVVLPSTSLGTVDQGFYNTLITCSGKIYSNRGLPRYPNGCHGFTECD
ncbi:hypothetical protein BDV96DRAFT_607128 [Lophiotrema nucula]|uniref:Uncharacterized protein n=1 Tax=Lophiotrema nucula TaxID=690887 RepID=A0A6A5YHC3_9PLEO|nr:hypothetical protein BDV96DRAFT_607128 [Lophiotrema nucula]